MFPSKILKRTKMQEIKSGDFDKNVFFYKSHSNMSFCGTKCGFPLNLKLTNNET